MAALQESGSSIVRRSKQEGEMKPCESEQDPSTTTSMPAEETRLREVQASAKTRRAPLLRQQRRRERATVPNSAAARLADVTVEDAELLDCGVCCLPLKRPIFQVINNLTDLCSYKAISQFHFEHLALSRWERGSGSWSILRFNIEILFSQSPIL